MAGQARRAVWKVRCILMIGAYAGLVSWRLALSARVVFSFSFKAAKKRYWVIKASTSWSTQDLVLWTYCVSRNWRTWRSSWARSMARRRSG